MPRALQCTYYQHNGLEISICIGRRSGDVIVTIDSRAFRYILMPTSESIHFFFDGNRMCELYVSHQLGRIDISECTCDGDCRDSDVQHCTDVDSLSTRSPEARQYLRELEEIAEMLLDQAAIAVEERRGDRD